MITYNFNYYYQNVLRTPSPNSGLTRRLHSVHTARPQRAHGALEDPTALPQRLHTALFNTLYKRQAAAFVLSVSIALLATAKRTLRRSAIF